MYLLMSNSYTSLENREHMMVNRKFFGLILGVLTAIVASGCAAPGANTPLLEAQNVYEVPGYSRQEIYERSKMWVADTFVDAKEVIEIADPEKGLIMANGAFDLVGPMSGKRQLTRFSLRIDVKDGKLRTTYKNFQMLTSRANWYTLREGSSSGYPDQARENVQFLNQSLLQFIRSEQSNDDW